MSGLKQIIKDRFPKTFAMLRNAKDQCMVEGRTLRQIGLCSIIRHLFSPTPAWEKELPLQTPSEKTLPDFSMSIEQFQESLAQADVSYANGAHCIYLSPESWRASKLAPLAQNYPEDAGIKISLQYGGLEEAYVLKEHSSATQRQLLPSHSALLMTGNFLFAKGLSPRMYDLLELNTPQGKIAAHILQHAPGEAPSVASCHEIINDLQNLTKQNTLELINFNGFEDKDFQCPACNGNLRTDSSGKSVYVDIQNFRIKRYDSHLRDTADEAMSTSHFGDKSYLLGGRYLYHAVPGLKAYAKRAPAQRMQTMREMLHKAGKSFHNAALLDIGCNIGLMSAQYLKEGAAWVHGWDMPEMIPHTEKMMLAVGCTRFSLTPRLLSKTVDIAADIPSFLSQGDLPLAISYLAVHKHIGWLSALKEIDWTFMIYEGHEHDTEEYTAAIFQELNEMTPIHVLCSGSIADGTSLARPLAIIAKGQR